MGSIRETYPLLSLQLLRITWLVSIIILVITIIGTDLSTAMPTRPNRGAIDMNTNTNKNNKGIRREDPLDALSDHHITQLATLLRLPPSNPLITTSHKGWQTSQAELIAKDLDPALKRRRGFSSCPLSGLGSKYGYAKLCSSHRGLRPDIIASCSAQLRELWDLGVKDFETILAEISNKPSINGLKRRSRDDWQKMLREYLEEIIKDIVGISGLTMTESELETKFKTLYLQMNNSSSSVRKKSGFFGGVIWGCEELDRNAENNPLFAGPEEKPFKYISNRCEACVLATVGRGGSCSKGKDGADVLVILKAALLVRRHGLKGLTGTETGTGGESEDVDVNGAREEEKPPGLLRLVDEWIRLAQKENQVQERRVEVDEKHPRGRRQRLRQIQRQYYARDKQTADIYGELPLTPYLQQPQPQPKPHSQRLSRPKPQQQEQVPRPQDAQPDPGNQREKQRESYWERQQLCNATGVSHDKKNDGGSVPTTIPFTRTTRKERECRRKDRLPKVYAIVSQLPGDATMYPRRIARRQRGKEDLRGEFESQNQGKCSGS